MISFKTLLEVASDREEFLDDSLESIYVLLDTFQEDEAQFTGASLTEKGINKLKQYVIDRFKITVPEEIAMLKIHQVPLDTYFKLRQKVDQEAKAAFGDDRY
tara:strand:+ start:187 stop:492 length:306 start_codon:yes stop_codon:yes gene_type:complete